MNKKILLITQIFYPDEVSTAGLFTKLCEVLAEDNIDVEVWCAQPSYTIRKRQPSKIIYKNIDIRYLFSTNFPKNSLFGRILNYLTFSVSLIFRLLFSKGKTLVFTHTTPPSLGILVSFLCNIKRRKFVYILLDIFPDGLIRLGKVSDKNFFIRVWEKLNIRALERSQRIVVIGRDMKKWVIEKVKDVTEKTTYLPLWQDERLIIPMAIEVNPFVRQNNLQGKFIVQYSGNMGLWQDMESLGELVVSLKQGDIEFVFIGDGMRRKELLESFKGEIPSNVRFFPFQPNKHLGNVLTACHIALISLRDGMTGMAVPSKIYGIMAAGVPSVAMVPFDSEVAMILKEEDCGIVVGPGDIQGLENAILRLKEDEKLRREMGKNARIAFENKYTVGVIAEKYKNLIIT